MLLLKYIIVFTSNLFMLMSFTNAIVTTTFGTAGGGSKCGEVYCEMYATCVDNVCHCGSLGNGQIKCYEDGSAVATYVSNDPLLSTLNGEKVNVPLLCTYSLSVQTTDLITSRIQKSRACEVSLIPYGGKNRGKIYTRGFYLSVKILTNSNTIEYLVHVDGYADNGMYHYDAKHLNGDSYFERDTVLADVTLSITDTDQGIYQSGVSYDTDYNIASVDISGCGIEVFFRAYDVELQHRQEMTPFIMMVTYTHHNPLFNVNGPSSLALGYNTTYPSWLSDLNVPPSSNVSKTMSLLDHYFNNNMSNPVINPACESAFDSYASCGNRFDTMLNCLPILETEKFINCYDDTDTGEKLMPLFNACLEIGCGNLTQCFTIPDRFGSCSQLPVSTVDFLINMC